VNEKTFKVEHVTFDGSKPVTKRSICDVDPKTHTQASKLSVDTTEEKKVCKIKYFSPNILAILWDIDQMYFRGAIQLVDTETYETLLFKEVNGILEDIYYYQHSN
jgi:hypothetical protein